ncbi:MAG: hypothetical protein MJH10_19970 [Epibacterium sp.]|nr:hypothetical protein [Epibacterium sp.]NQX75757.1 hypothetical protein [Epibacterium sp.]
MKNLNVILDSIEKHWPNLRNRYGIASEFHLGQLPALIEAAKQSRFVIQPVIDLKGYISAPAMEFEIYWKMNNSDELIEPEKVEALAETANQIYDELCYRVILDIMRYLKEHLP